MRLFKLIEFCFLQRYLVFVFFKIKREYLNILIVFLSLMFLTAFFYALIMSFILGIVHGITPDEHTWPITFSYAVGSGTVEGGAKAGLVFSAGFTLQRALMSEIAYFVFVGFMLNPFFSGVVYIIVGAAMVFAGSYILNKGIYPHWHWLEEKLGVISTLHSKDSEYHTRELEHSANPVCCEEGGALKAAPTSMAFIHGIIAGFGFGAFALILFTRIFLILNSKP
jgi:hypothetical protein